MKKPKITEPPTGPLSIAELQSAYSKAIIAEKVMGFADGASVNTRVVKELMAFRQFPRLSVTLHEHHDSTGTSAVCRVRNSKGEEKSLYGAWPITEAGFTLKTGGRFLILVAELPPDPKVRPTKNPFRKCHHRDKKGKMCGRIGAEWCDCKKKYGVETSILLCDRHMSGHRCRKERS